MDGKKTESRTGVGAKSLQGKKIVVNAVDNSINEVLELDEKGATLVFETGVGRFLKLKKSEVDQLGKWNRDRYLVCVDVAEAEAQIDEDGVEVDEIIQSIEFGVNRGSATGRLHIDNKDAKYKYWWEAPENVYRKQTQGWQVVQRGKEMTLHSKGDRIHRIGKKGEEELILMKIPVEKAQAISAERMRKHKALTEARHTQSKADIEKSGFEAVDDQTSRRVKFTPLEKEGTR